MPNSAYFGNFRFGSGTTFGYIAPVIISDPEGPLKAEVVTVTTTPTVLAQKGTTTVPNSVLVAVPTGGATVYIGGEDVTADAEPTGGLPVAGTQSLGWDLLEEDHMYAVVSSGTQIVRVLRRNPE
jgi:hypothetical protein